MAKGDQRTPPPLDIVVPGNHQHRTRAFEFSHKRPGGNHLAVSCPLCQIARDYGCLGRQIRYQVLNRADLSQVHIGPKVRVGQMYDTAAHTAPFLT